MATKFNRYTAGNTFTIPAGTKVRINGATRTQAATRVVTATGVRATRNASGALTTEVLWKSYGYTASAVI
jgi:hypothetical protein